MPEKIAARGFGVIDSAARVHVQMCMEHGMPKITLYDAQGKERTTMGVDANLLLEIAVTNQDDVFLGNASNDADNTGTMTSRAFAFKGSNSGFAGPMALVTTFGTTTESLLPCCSWVVAWLGSGASGGASLAVKLPTVSGF